LSSFAAEVTRVAREVGTEGNLGGQAHVQGVSGVWKDLTDNVNFMASNLTSQVRGIAQVVTAVARGALDRKLTVEAKGEIAELSDTINSMINTLATFADQVTTVAREVGVEGKLGGQASVPGAAGPLRQYQRYPSRPCSQKGPWKDRSDRLDRDGRVERYLSEVREGKAYTEQPPAPAQRCPGGARLERGAGERGNLTWLPHDRAEYGEDIRRAVVPQAGDRGRRKLAVRRIDDRATGGKWNSVGGGDSGGNVRFVVNGDRTRSHVKPALFQGMRDGRIRPDDLGMQRSRKRGKKRPRPCAIGRKTFLLGPHAGADHPVARSEMGRESAGDAETDNARRAAPGRPVEGSDELRRMSADHRHARPEGNAGLKRETGDCDYVPPSRHPTPIPSV